MKPSIKPTHNTQTQLWEHTNLLEHSNLACCVRLLWIWIEFIYNIYTKLYFHLANIDIILIWFSCDTFLFYRTRSFSLPLFLISSFTLARRYVSFYTISITNIVSLCLSVVVFNPICTGENLVFVYFTGCAFLALIIIPQMINLLQ